MNAPLLPRVCGFCGETTRAARRLCCERGKSADSAPLRAALRVGLEWAIAEVQAASDAMPKASVAEVGNRLGISRRAMFRLMKDVPAMRAAMGERKRGWVRDRVAPRAGRR